MDRLKKHEDELNFFARELQSKRALHGWWSYDGLPITLYEVFSDYGRSYIRPISWFLISSVLGLVVFENYFGETRLGLAIGLSLANTFGAFGFRKDFIDSEVVNVLSPGLKVFSAGQTLFGIILIFLLGLAIRNRLRMK